LLGFTGNLFFAGVEAFNLSPTAFGSGFTLATATLIGATSSLGGLILGVETNKLGITTPLLVITFLGFTLTGNLDFLTVLGFTGNLFFAGVEAFNLSPTAFGSGFTLATATLIGATSSLGGLILGVETNKLGITTPLLVITFLGFTLTGNLDFLTVSDFTG